MVAPRPDISHEFQLHLKSSNFSEALKLLKLPEHEMNINEIVYDEFYPIHLACAAGELELTLELISQGADPCVETAVTKNNPLHFAARNGHKCVVEILLRSGADPSVPNSSGLIPAELTKDKTLLALLMRTNWISQRSNQNDESLELLLQNMTISKTSPAEHVPDDSSKEADDYFENESKSKKSIKIAIPESRSELNLPYQGHSKFTEKLADKREKPNRRYSLPAGHPAIRLVDSPQKREYRVLNTARRVTPPSLTPVIEESPPSLPIPPPPLSSDHNLPFSLPVPHALRESPQSPSAKKTFAPARSANPTARLKYAQLDEIGSPLNRPSNSRKAIPAHPPVEPPPQSNIAAFDNHAHSSPPLSDRKSHKHTIRSSIANIWNQTEIEFSDDEGEESSGPSSIPFNSYQTPVQVSIASSLSHVDTDRHEIPPRAQTGSLSAGLVTDGLKKSSVNSQRSRSESDVECRYDSITGFILPPPSTSPSFPMSLSRGSSASKINSCEDRTEERQQEYHTSSLLSPNTLATQMMVAPIVPLDEDPRSHSTLETSRSEDYFDDQRMVDAATQVSIEIAGLVDTPPPLNARVQTMTQVREEVEEIMASQSAESLHKMVLQAAEETAYSYQTINSLGGKRKDIFKACQQIRKELMEELKTTLTSEPELATCRSCGVLSNFAPDGSTPLHCAARWGNADVVTLLLSLRRAQSDERLVDVWSRDLQGRVPLHLAAEFENEEVCRKLIAAMTGIDNNTTPSPSPQTGSRSVIGSAAPVDLTGTTPLGWASRRKKGRPSSPIRELLYGPGDNSILPQRVYSERSGKTPIRRAYHRSNQSTNRNPMVGRGAVIGIGEGVSGGEGGGEMRLQADHIVFAHSEAQGWRPEMEDAVVSCCPLLSSNDSSCSELQTCWLFGVFDGHGGDFSSKFVAKHFPSVLLSAIERRGDASPAELGKLLSECCQSMDALLSEEERMKVTAKWTGSGSGGGAEGKVRLNLRDTSGTTSCICLFTLDDLFLANIGDSRAVLAREISPSPVTSSGTVTAAAMALSTDQKLSLVEERTRALTAGCLVQLIEESTGLYEVSSPLHSCKLRMSRSIGDFYLKWRAVDQDLSIPEQQEQHEYCSATKGSYSVPLICVSGTPTDAPPRHVALQSPSQQAVSCLPVVTHQPRCLESDLFLLIACDGVWDVMSNEEAIDFISSQLMTSLSSALSSSAVSVSDEDLQRIAASTCDQLLAECLQRRSNDNMTAILILFPRMNYLLNTQQHQYYQQTQQRSACHTASPVLSDSPLLLSSSVMTPIFQRHPQDRTEQLLSGEHEEEESTAKELREQQQHEQEGEMESPLKAKRLF